MIIDFSFGTTRTGKQRIQLCDSASRIVTEDYLNFGYDYFDNNHSGIGYGGYRYDGRYKEAAARICEHYHLKPGDKVLEIGCAKGYLLVEFFYLGIDVYGCDISKYAVEQAHPDIKGSITCGDAVKLNYQDQHFDLVYAKEVLPHIHGDNLEKTIQECMRVAKKNVFFEIQVGETDLELEYLEKWDLTHKACRTSDWWSGLFERLNYKGDLHFKVLTG